MPLATPTRFLIESGEWTLTPHIGGSIQNEMNPFDCNFQQRIPTTKTNTDTWSPSSTSSSVAMYTSPEPEMAIDTATPSTPPMSVTQSPSSASSFSSISDQAQPQYSPQQSEDLTRSQFTFSEETRRSGRQAKPFFSEFLKEEDTEYNPRSASVQSGRKRRIVFEGDDAEDRRKKFLERNRVAGKYH